MDRHALLHKLSRVAFGGPVGRMAARGMENSNRDMEIEAADRVNLRDSDAVLSIGFGPGMGVEVLLERLPDGWVGGIDPSNVMRKRAAARNRDAMGAGQVRLERADTRRIPWPDATFDGATSVNTLQLWYPLSESANEVARVLKPGASLVTLTHHWAIDKITDMTVDEWLEQARQPFQAAGFWDVIHGRGTSEDGNCLLLAATRR